MREYLSNPPVRLPSPFLQVGLHYGIFGTPSRAGSAASRKTSLKNIFRRAKCESRVNLKHDMSLGVLRIQFVEPDRRAVSQVFWKEKDGDFLPCSTTVTYGYPTSGDSYAKFPEELPSGASFSEGSVKQILVNHYERDNKLRGLCIAAHGTKCLACGFSFGATYGSAAEGYIHVHHCRPISEVGKTHDVDPVADLEPVCPNCHAVMHLRIPPFSIEEIKDLLTLHKIQHS